MIIAGYFVFSASANLIHSYRLHNDEARLREDIEELKLQQDQLLQIRDYLRTDEYVEFMARRVFGLVKPGEVLVTVDAPAPQGANNPGTLDSKWWQRLFGR
jgi:cell division protein FtsB